MDALLILRHPGDITPYLFSSKGEHRRHEPCHGLQDLIDRPLGCTAFFGFFMECIEAVFKNIQIERAHVYNAEIVKGMEDDVEFKVLVPLSDTAGEPPEPVKRPPINLKEFVIGYPVALRIKVIQVPKKESAGIPDPPVGLCKLDKDLFGYPDILPVILCRHPEP